MLESGVWVEVIRNNVTEDAEIVPKEAENVPEVAEIVPDEPQYDRLTATPKAVQLELELF